MRFRVLFTLAAPSPPAAPPSLEASGLLEFDPLALETRGGLVLDALPDAAVSDGEVYGSEELFGRGGDSNEGWRDSVGDRLDLPV